ncbi:MAG: hypothetical protein C0453_00615 [Comamonadaceae bacterium]|nr:hypothetical protein [Comamonadaceae bacterium]
METSHEVLSHPENRPSPRAPELGRCRPLRPGPTGTPVPLCADTLGYGRRLVAAPAGPGRGSRGVVGADRRDHQSSGVAACAMSPARPTWLSRWRTSDRSGGAVDLGTATDTLIGSRTGLLELPVRSVLFGNQRLRQHAISLAQAQRVAVNPESALRWRRKTFFPRLLNNKLTIARANAYLECLDRNDQELSPAGEWLLDNAHLLTAQVTEIRNALPRGYYRALPKLVDPPLAGLPRIYGMAWALVAHTDSSFDEPLMVDFVNAYQQQGALSLGELWAIPVTLRAVLLENLARLSDRVVMHLAVRQAVDRICTTAGTDLAFQLDALQAGLADPDLRRCCVARVQLQWRSAEAPQSSQMTSWLAGQRVGLEEPGGDMQQLHAADNVSVSNAVRSLHLINNLDWTLPVARMSEVIQRLDESAAFRAESDLSRDQCTHAIEQLARQTRRTEIEVTQAAASMVPAAPDAMDPGPAHWLIGDGRRQLLAALGTRGLAADRWQRWMAGGRGWVYAGLMSAGVAWLTLALLQTAAMSWATVLVWPVAVLVISEAVIALLNRTLAESVRVRRLPRLALASGLQSEHRTLVIVPCLLSSPAAIETLLQRLEQHHLANTEAHTCFALLSDWLDAPQASVEGDERLLTQALDGIARLNERHGSIDEQTGRFALLHRPRTWSESERAWIGWERKRGKIEALLEWLVEEDPTANGPFMPLGPHCRIGRGYRFVITLDADTGMPPGALREMVSIAAHPLNQPCLDPVTRRVISGYGILQPRISSPVPARDDVTPFGWLFAGPWGFDLYNAGSSELYQDLFAQGSFQGKGLLNIAAVHASLKGRTPQESLLSHDLYEGIWAGAAHLSDVSLVEESPLHPAVASARMHRWIRGDWQLLPLMRLAFQGRAGPLSQWKMLDNLRRSLIAPASLALLWLSWGTGVVAPAQALLAVLAALGLGPLISAVAGLVPGRSHLAWRHFIQGGAVDIARALGGTLWLAATLPHAALSSTDAIARTLWRLLVSRRRLLEWTTAAQAQAHAGTSWAWFWKKHWPASALALAWTLSALAMPQAATGWLVSIGLVWMFAPVWLWLAGQPVKVWRRPRTLGKAEREYLSQLAREIWAFFEATVTAADHHLPPDNLQLDPRDMLARRTSPTNVGLYLTSCLCAHRFGFIDSDELVQRLQKTLDTLDTLPRWNGHICNWTDTATLQPLGPVYVSTVDSGNMAACLLVCAQACTELARTEPQAKALSELARRLGNMAMAMDFAVLYDRRRRLFHIGYRVDDATPDVAYYDLLASESRITSFVAIAKGDVPLNHWQALGRPFLPFDGQPILRSWSGSMFEYLMPSALMREPEGTLLQRTTVLAVQAQQRFGFTHGVPWGVSESAYFEQDSQRAFQYGPFGVPFLALRRTPSGDLVIAPYATVLGLLADPAGAIANLQALEQNNARDRFGFIEALDFTPARAGEEGAPHRVATYMAHHQGMGLLSLCNVLCEDAPRKWFGRAPLLRAFDHLLHERLPRAIVYQADAIPRPPHKADDQPTPPSARVLDPATMDRADAPSFLLGNGSQGVCLRPNGAGQGNWRGLVVGRARDDLLRDAQGTWILTRVGGEARFHSITQAPCPRADARHQADFGAALATFDASMPDWAVKMQVWVSPDSDVELRQVCVHCQRDEALEIELATYTEVALTTQAADVSHPAFSKLFLLASAPSPGCLAYHRKAHREGEQEVWMAHFVAFCSVPLNANAVSMACDRAQLLPRHGDISNFQPQGMLRGAHDTLHTGLDPVASLHLKLRIEGHARLTLVVATAMAGNISDLMAIVDEYRQRVYVDRSRQKAEVLASIWLREWRIKGADLELVQLLTTRMAMNRSRMMPEPAHALDRRTLWRLSISGDRPLVLVRIHGPEGLRALRLLLIAHRHWVHGGIACDLLILNGEPISYLMTMQRQLQELCDSLGAAPQPGTGPASVSLRRQHDITEAELSALASLARIDFTADGRPLNALMPQASHTPHTPTTRRRLAPMANLARPSMAHWAFVGKGSGVRMALDEAHATPRPWSNVLANPHFGCIVTDSGGGFTWAINSRMNQLTPWSNDALQDPAGEHYLVHDLDRGTAWSLMPTGERNGRSGYLVTHRPGSSDFVQERPGWHAEVRVAVHPDAAAKVLRVRLTNTGDRPQTLRVLACAEWVLGAGAAERMSVSTGYWSDAQAVQARQMDHAGGFGDGTAFLMQVGLPVQGWTCERSQFFDQQGRLQMPDTLGGEHGFGIDPCGALMGERSVDPGTTLEYHWVMGYGAGPEAARSLALRLQATGELDGLMNRVQAQWNTLLGAIEVKTPDPLFDAMVNHWLPYQTLACRLWARAGFYQVSGATGFRDQLQDAMALVVTQPGLLRSQLLLHASRQFLEGDVQHWWHSPSGAGVRTRCSDDMLWLPHAIQRYCEVTGDFGVLAESAPFLEGAEIPTDQSESYFTPLTSDHRASLYEHAARAIERSLQLGTHQLPLMGSGDWNDGMNRVGHQGRGESVWLAMFLIVVLRPWVGHARSHGDEVRARSWEAASLGLEQALRKSGWDGEWFRRAYLDDGSPLGSRTGDECRIDLLVQAWSVWALPPGDPLARQAMQSADRLLVDRERGLIRLFDPPLQSSSVDVGYVQSYPPGVRENGGQYNHAAVWALMAQAHLGHPHLAWEYLRMVSPAHRSATPEAGARYGLEPYVMPGDVYTQSPLAGRGGWSWYSGSAGWLYRACVESLIGLDVQADQIRFSPCLPSAWPGMSLQLRLRGHDIRVNFQRREANGIMPTSTGSRIIESHQWLPLEDLATSGRLTLMLPPAERSLR